MSVRVFADGLDGAADFFESLPGLSDQAASIAINTNARGSALKLSRDEIYKQINFPAGYIDDNRLFVDKFSKPDDLEAIVRGRDRPTSLARFATKGAKPGDRGVSVQVHKGKTKYMKKGFLIKLRAGKTMDGTTFNVGLAIRLAPGEKINNKTLPATVYASSLGPNVVLLYGPSVDQAFKGVAEEVAPQVADNVATEFFRQLARLTNG